MMEYAASTNAHKVRQAELARILGISRQSVGELVQRGVIQIDKDQLIDVEQAKAALLNRVNPGAKSVASIAPSIKNTPPAPVPENDDQAITSYHVAKTLREAAEAQMARIKLAEMQGKYLLKTEVKSVAFEVARALRDGLTNCARRIAADVAGIATAEECEAVIDKEHRAFLENMIHVINSRFGATDEDATA